MYGTLSVFLHPGPFFPHNLRSSCNFPCVNEEHPLVLIVGSLLSCLNSTGPLSILCFPESERLEGYVISVDTLPFSLSVSLVFFLFWA